MELKNGIQVQGFCCTGYAWRVFDIDASGAVYSECGNSNCTNQGVFLPELNEVEPLKAKLAKL